MLVIEHYTLSSGSMRVSDFSQGRRRRCNTGFGNVLYID